jgi:uncharacterized membrane protein YvlD (DUF360 family)
MKRRLISLGFLLGANALGLLLAAILLRKVSISVGSFLVALVIFTAVNAVARPLVAKLAEQHADALTGVTSLAAVLIGLIVTSVLSDGLDIGGTATWLLAAVIVWLVSVIAGVVLPRVLLKEVAGDQA